MQQRNTNDSIKASTAQSLDLYIKNNSFYNARGGRKIIFRGISTMLFGRDNRPLNYKEVNYFLSSLDYLKKYQGINLVQLYLSEHKLEDNEYLLDQVVDHFEEENIYIYFCPASFSNDRNLEANDKVNAGNFVANLAKKYISKKNLLYCLWAEPNFATTDEWEKYYVEGIKTIRKKNARAKIGIAGNFYGRFFPEKSILFEDKNVFLDFHDYPAADSVELSKIMKNTTEKPFLWDGFYLKYPVLIGEFGGVWKSGFNSPEDLSYIRRVVADAKNKDLGIISYSLDNDFSNLFNKEDLSLTPRGQAFFKQ